MEHLKQNNIRFISGIKMPIIRAEQVEFARKLSFLQDFAANSKRYKIKFDKELAISILQCYFKECFLQEDYIPESIVASIMRKFNLLKCDFSKNKFFKNNDKEIMFEFVNDDLIAESTIIFEATNEKINIKVFGILAAEYELVLEK